MKIVFIGDSITDANHNYSEDALGEGYVKIIADELKKSKQNVDVLNKGHDGFTVYSLWKFLEHDCISKRPDIVSILIGCNDVSVQMSTGKTVEEQGFSQIYDKILKTIKQKTETKVICMGPFIFPYPAEFRNWIPQIKKVEEMTQCVAEKNGALFLPLHDVLQDAVEKAETARIGYEKITTDGTHLTMEGARILAEKWLAATANWLDKTEEIG